MKLIEKNKDQIVFAAEIDESLANAIRRYVNHVPVLAVDELEISRNDSPLYDETVAHRVGLIPIKMGKAFEKKKKTLNEIRRAVPNAEIKEKGGKITIEDKGKTDVVDVCEGIAHKENKKAEVVLGKDLIITVQSF